MQINNNTSPAVQQVSTAGALAAVLKDQSNILGRFYGYAAASEPLTDNTESAAVHADGLLETYIDFMRVMMEPSPLGEFPLNRGLMSLDENLPAGEVHFGYASYLSESGQSFHSFYKNTVLPGVQRIAHHRRGTAKMLMALCVGDLRYNLTEVSEIAESVGQGAYGESNVRLLSPVQGICLPDPGCCIGFANDSSLDDRCRASIWLFWPAE